VRSADARNSANAWSNAFAVAAEILDGRLDRAQIVQFDRPRQEAMGSVVRYPKTVGRILIT